MAHIALDPESEALAWFSLLLIIRSQARWARRIAKWTESQSGQKTASVVGDEGVWDLLETLT
jgi:hypothetical protein